MKPTEFNAQIVHLKLYHIPREGTTYLVANPVNANYRLADKLSAINLHPSHPLNRLTKLSRN